MAHAEQHEPRMPSLHGPLGVYEVLSQLRIRDLLQLRATDVASKQIVDAHLLHRYRVHHARMPGQVLSNMAEIIKFLVINQDLKHKVYLFVNLDIDGDNVIGAYLMLDGLIQRALHDATTRLADAAENLHTPVSLPIPPMINPNRSDYLGLGPKIKAIFKLPSGQRRRHEITRAYPDQLFTDKVTDMLTIADAYEDLRSRVFHTFNLDDTVNSSTDGVHHVYVLSERQSGILGVYSSRASLLAGRNRFYQAWMDVLTADNDQEGIVYVQAQMLQPALPPIPADEPDEPDEIGMIYESDGFTVRVLALE